MDALLKLLEARKWKEDCLRTNIAGPEHIEVSDSGFKRVRLASNVVSPSEGDLRAAIQQVAPCCTDEYQIIVNRNVTCRPHRDPANVGPSYCLFLGDFEGGALIFADGKRFTEKGVWHVLDGRIEHWNEPQTGTKYSVILYRPGRTSKSRLIKAYRNGGPPLAANPRNVAAARPAGRAACAEGARTGGVQSERAGDPVTPREADAESGLRSALSEPGP